VTSRRAILALGAFAALLTIAASGRGAAETLREYHTRVDRWARDLSLAGRQLAAGDPAWRATVRGIEAEARAEAQIERPSGGPVRVRADWLADAVREALDAPDQAGRRAALDEAAKGLAAYQQALDGAPSVDVARARAALARALPAPAAGAPRLGWLKSILERIGRWLERLLGLLPEGAGRSVSWLGWVVFGFAVLLLVAVLVLAVRSLVRSFARSERRRISRVEALEPPAPSDPDALLARAREAAAGGAYAEAIRLLYLALLLRLDAAGLLRYRRSHTNWEYLGMLGAAGLREPFSSFTSIFDRKHYGREPATESDYGRCQSLFEQMLQAAGGT